ncbi:MAG: ATP-binding cassette domain-containing protein [Candidatus Verstraetearchaeota archaeon]|nr:ATP-binding cassette domain-containing protein [Candidatus Verstraetearchaeota archaeon]
MIELIDLYVSYGWRREPIIKGVSARFDGLHLVLGPNGSGKTTLFRAIAGLTPITSGKILIDGVDIDSIYGKPGILAINLGEI